MADPLQVHAEALADLDRQIERARAMGRKVARLGWGGDDLDLRGLEGRRRILQRHAPGAPRAMESCSYCEWPTDFGCPDWRDAAGQETPDAG